MYAPCCTASQYVRPSTVLITSTSVSIGHNGGGNTITIGKTDGDTLAFFGSSGASRPTPSQLTTGSTANADATDATFTGDDGSTAYTVGDLVKIFKGYGLLKQ